MDVKLSKIYYSPQGYWKGLAAVKKLATAANVSEDVAKRWLTNQALWQIYLPAPRHILGKSLMSPCLMQCIKQTFFFCLMTNSPMEKRFTNML